MDLVVNKITDGCVIQIYINTKCVSQEFYAGDIVGYEDEDGNPVDEIKDEVYQPFDMVQP